MIEELLRAAIEKQARKDLHSASFFRASSAGHCVRKQIAVRAGLEPTCPSTASGLVKMWMGTELGKVIQACLENEGFLVPAWTEREVHYRSYKGHVDGLTRSLPGCDEYGPAIVEFKTSSDDAVTKYDWPEHYFWQNGLYLLAAGLKRGVIFQIGREYGLSREKVFLLTDEWKIKIDTHISEVEKAWKEYELTGVLPPCKHRFGWEDKLCGYRTPKELKEPKVVPQKTVNPFESTPESRELSGFIDEVTQGEQK